jgi:PAS domain S-box-containing protein
MLLNAKGSPNASFWLPAGLYVAVLLLHEYKDWPWLVLAATAANVPFDLLETTPGPLLGVFILANTVEALLGAWLVRKFVAARPTIATLPEYIGLVFYAAIFSNLVGAAVSAAGQQWLGLTQSVARSFANWWGSTTMATLILAPFLLAWSVALPFQWARLWRLPRVLETVALFGGLIAVEWWILVRGDGIKSPNKAPLLMFLIWAGLRFGVRGATAANLVCALATGYLTQHYHRGLAPADLTSGIYVLGLQVGLAMATTLGLIPAIVLGEQEKTAGELRESEEKFSKAFRCSPNGIAITELATGRYIDVNDSFSQTYGFARHEMIGRTSLELGVFRSVADREKVIGPFRATGHLRDFELRMITPRGEAKTVLVNAEKMELEGKPCMVLVIFDITARLEAEECLEKTSRQLRALAYRVQSLREEERTHLAREIHDHLGQLLTALSLDLRLLERKAAAVGDTELRAAISGKVASARQLADETITSVQRIATELRPPTLDRLGLEAAVEVEAQAFQVRTGVVCQWTLPSEPVAVNPEQATAVFRIFQEILTNVARHAQARTLAVRLSQGPEDLLLEVEDDGRGIQPEDIANPRSLGLLGMQERAAILGGRITFGRNQPAGTSVVVRVPLNQRERPAS